MTMKNTLLLDDFPEVAGLELESDCGIFSEVIPYL